MHQKLGRSRHRGGEGSTFESGSSKIPGDDTGTHPGLRALPHTKNTNRAKIQIFALLTALRNLQIVTRRPDVYLRDKLPLVLFSSSLFWELVWYIVHTAAKSRLAKMDGSDEYGGRYPR